MSENRSGRNHQPGWHETPAVCYNGTGLEKRSQGWSLFVRVMKKSAKEMLTKADFKKYTARGVN